MKKLLSLLAVSGAVAGIGMAATGCNNNGAALAERDQTIEQLEKENQDLVAKVSELEGQTAEDLIVINNALEAIKSAELALDALVNSGLDAAQKQESIGALSKVNVALERTIQALDLKTANYSALKDRYNGLIAKYDATLAKLDAANIEISGLEEIIRNNESEITRLEDEISKYELEVATWEQLYWNNVVMKNAYERTAHVDTTHPVVEGFKVSAQGHFMGKIYDRLGNLVPYSNVKMAETLFIKQIREAFGHAPQVLRVYNDGGYVAVEYAMYDATNETGNTKYRAAGEINAITGGNIVKDGVLRLPSTFVTRSNDKILGDVNVELPINLLRLTQGKVEGVKTLVVPASYIQFKHTEADLLTYFPGLERIVYEGKTAPFGWTISKTLEVNTIQMLSAAQFKAQNIEAAILNNAQELRFDTKLADGIWVISTPSSYETYNVVVLDGKAQAYKDDFMKIAMTGDLTASQSNFYKQVWAATGKITQIELKPTQNVITQIVNLIA